MVFVLNKDKKPLSPCHPAKARRLLKQGKAVIHKKYPFTIRLKELKQAETQNKTKYCLKIDYGSRHTGLAVLKNNKEVIWLAQIRHRTDIKKKIDDRRTFRRRRRNENLRYRKCRFDNRKKVKGWIPPSLQSRVANIETWVNRLLRLCSITRISYENAKFDTQLIRNPEISGIEYQQGLLKGYEVREYLLEKYNRKCVYCGRSNIPLEVEHIIPKSRGGTDRIDNLAIACRECNERKANMTAEEFGFPDIQKQARQTLKDCAIINTTRWKIYETLITTGLPVECGTGATTKMNRIKLGLSKEHYFDACCVGISTPDMLYFKIGNVLHIKAKGRGTRSRTNLDRYGFPRGHLVRQKFFFGFQTGDIIKAMVPKGKYQGIWCGETACRKTGCFDIKNKEGQRIAQGISYKYCTLTQQFNGYTYKNAFLPRLKSRASCEGLS